MAHAPLEQHVLVAPRALDIEHHGDFRREAVALLEAMQEGAGRLVVDLSATRSVDSLGIAALIQVRRWAAQRRQVVRLRGVNAQLRSILALTKLENVFEVDDEDSLG